MRMLVLVALLLTACAEKPTQQQCTDLLAHTVQLEYEASGGAVPPPDRLAKDQQKLTAYVGKDFLEQCMKQLPKKRVVCGLAATSKEELLACDDTKSE